MSHKYNEHEKRKNFNFPVAHVNGREEKNGNENWTRKMKIYNELYYYYDDCE